jgi:hypothetical protein
MAIQAFPPSSPSGVPSGTTETRPSNPSVGQPFYNGTLGIIEIYTAGEVWSPLGGVTPDSPVSLSAADVGTNIDYANGTADISFTVGGGGIPTEFIVTPSPTTSPTTFTGSSSPVRVTGLTLGTQYSFTAQSRNGIGTSISSAATNSITPTTVPQAPTIGTAVPVTGVAFGSSPSITLPFTAAASGGKSITNYKWSTDGTNYTAFSPARTTSPFTFASLTAGTSYSFTLKAVNDNGDSAASSVSTITAATVPDAPTITSSVGYGTSGQVVVDISPGNNGGSEITSYTVTASPGGATGTGSSTTIAVNGLTNNTTYTFTAVATNAVGNSTSSSGSSGTPISLSPTIATAEGGYGNSGNTGGAGGSGGGSGADSGNNGGAVGGYDGSNGAGGRPGGGQLGVGYGSGTNPYIPVGGTGLQNGQPSATYAGLGPNSAGSGVGTFMNQDNTSTRVSGVGRGSGGSEGGWVAQGSAGIDGLVAWTNTAGGSGIIEDTVSSWAPPVSSNYTFYVIGGGGGGAGGYRGPGGSGYYATGSRFLTTSNRLTVTIGTGGARGGRFGTGGRGGTTSVVVAS